MILLLNAGCQFKNGNNLLNVIIISIECLRQDHLSFHNYSRQTTPNLQKFSLNSYVFANAYSTTSSTTPSIYSILTGFYPINHHVRILWQSSPKSILTLPKLLKTKEYITVAVVCNYVLISEGCNLHNDFDIYDDHMEKRELNRNVYERIAENATNRAITYLKKVKSRPFFLWIHYQDPHGPYYPPESWRNYFGNAEKKIIPMEAIPDYVRINHNNNSNFYIDQYDNEIVYLDFHIGRLIKYLKKSKLLNKSIIIIVADHGESMIEHEKWFTHGYHVYEELTKIPFLIYLPNKKPKEEKYDLLISQVDIFPTLLDILSINYPCQFDGISIAPLLEEKSWSSRRSFIFIESFPGKYAIVGKNGYKLIMEIDQKKNISKKYAFNLRIDASELNVIFGGAQFPIMMEKKLKNYIAEDVMPQNLKEIYGIQPLRIGPKRTNYRQILERLRALGYTH